ncbi:FAD-binding and (Fe-S)-binding domain-containing protein [Xanthocytophaga flava]|uniref:FAD-binding and (Fe-S)-binding domain-containing protein n=1 Tax=Xanthocytophaga flava TaxID=3048013 RepID=UPI0028D23B5E|nr:FAD-linked oxidase C-terminal domain-containing protein [Xanthocytophaga flavus]MDJ1468664.1 FAD-linked oxidase C-terminal domain-containing protein [Xanthocytophaga flavus]
MEDRFQLLAQKLIGELYWDNAMRTVYATDASAYQETPLAVAHPKTNHDIQTLIRFADENQITLIPRAAGTSLAGQVVGKGLVVDISKHMTQILEINETERWVRVQPGVIRDDLNKVLLPYGLFFGPETSTASRAMIGGMVGNNSCGLHSIVWGTTRDHLLAVKGYLSDGSEVEFRELTDKEFEQKKFNPLDFGVSNFIEQIPANRKFEHRIYNRLDQLLSNTENQTAITDNFPKPTIRRRNSGYALDAFLPYYKGSSPNRFNLSKLIAGSEGTLMFLTEIKLNLLPLPPKETAIVCIHANSIDEALRVNQLVMHYHAPMASELVDKYILDFTNGHPEYHKNRFFIEGDPQAILMVEFMEETQEAVAQRAEKLVADLKQAGLGYAYPVIYGEPTKQVWDVRKAGLGLIRNLPGDTQPVNLIEDCAVDVTDLPAYIRELEQLLQRYNLTYSMYAHAGAGELHVEPMINLKTTEGNALFREILAQTAALVKKYGGALSGEHGDGRLRGEFIPFMMGDKVYQLFKEVKRIFDPNGVFNAGKIVDTPPMNAFLRYKPDQAYANVDTVFSFSRQENVLRLTEKCSGSGDCRKTHLTGGTMCPSYMATRDEKDTTRARANSLRDFLTKLPSSYERSEAGKAAFMDKAGQGVARRARVVKEVMDLCLSCKGCKSECPSNVDIAKLKAEFLQHYHDVNGIPLRSWLVGNFAKQMQVASMTPWVYNTIFGTTAIRKIANRFAGFHPDRSMPLLAKTPLRKWYDARVLEQASHTTADSHSVKTNTSKIVYLFCDEFTNFNDVEIGKKTIFLLEKLGYTVIIPEHHESGRSYLSKGMVRDAQTLAVKNVELLKDLITEETPLIGIEPSAILSFRDEYIDLVPESLQQTAIKLAKNALLIEEFFEREINAGNIRKEQFNQEKRLIKLHGHCHQKALASVVPTKKMLALPANYEVQLIPSGCCGMAGSFGYEREHYEVSMKIGELVLFPTVRKQPEEVIIAAPGTSCRHQIHDGTHRKALHPVEVLFDALV